MKRSCMYKLFFLLLISLLFLGCGGDPAPEKNSLEALRAKMSGSHEERFRRDGSHTQAVKKKKSDRKRADDPSAYVYKNKVLSNKAEKSWKAEGISNKEYPKWARLGMKPKEVSQWKKLSISYAAIEVFKKHKYTPKTAQKFMEKKFFTRPHFYSKFGTPVYEFDSICQSVVKRQSPPFAFLEEKCLPYMQASHKNEAIGHLIDEAKLKKGPLALQYLAELRRLAEENSKIQSGMEVTLEEFVEDEDSDNFVFLFPLLKSEPTQEEMAYIDTQKLPLEETERFYSFENPQYWINRAEAKAAAEEEAARQEALLRAKKESERKMAQLRLEQAQKKAKEKARKEALYKQKQRAVKAENMRRQKAKKLCGEYLNPDHLSGKEVLIEGNVLFTVGEPGEKMFGYGIKARDDQKTYFIRDPKNLAQVSIKDRISWKLKTMGRTEALSKRTSKQYEYDKKSKTKFTMALYLNECRVQ